MNKINKNQWLIGGFLLILISTGFVQYKNSLPEKKAVVKNIISVKQNVTIDSLKRQLSHKVKLGTTALQLLGSSYKIQTKGEGKNAFITAIGEREASIKRREFWAFYVNGKQATVGAGGYFLKNNDIIEWKIETY